MVFSSREDAGRQLGALLKAKGLNLDIVLGLPRGGVVVAAEVAHTLGLPLDVLIVRKIGHPLQREYAVGALAEPDVILIDERIVGSAYIIRAELEKVIREEKDRLQAYCARFHSEGGLNISGKSVVLVDDGLATGATTEAAVLSARQHGALQIVVAAPVASVHAVDRLHGVADQVIALDIDPEFDAVGRYYKTFQQTSDQEVLELLKAA